MTHRPLVAVLGGGQLGRMLGLAGVPMGARFRFLDPSAEAGARAVGELVVGALDDPAALDAVAAGADFVTYEWEGVPAAAVDHLLAGGHRVAPGRDALATSQDRLVEKQRFAKLGITTAPFAAAGTRAELDAAIEAIGTPAILKTRTGGYDGKGQYRLSSPADADAAWAALGGAPAILEGLVAFDRELSVLATRAADGATVVYPLAHNEHRDGILRVTCAPVADVSPAVAGAAHQLVTRLLDDTGYIGTVCVELFQRGDSLLANEYAPRVHNSGHWTIEGATTSQFANHLRAGLGLPLGDAAARGWCAMVNCIGRLPDPAAVLAIPGTHFHDYAKSARRGRKVGHVSITAPDEEAREDALARVLAVIEDDG